MTVLKQNLEMHLLGLSILFLGRLGSPGLIVRIAFYRPVRGHLGHSLVSSDQKVRHIGHVGELSEDCAMVGCRVGRLRTVHQYVD